MVYHCALVVHEDHLHFFLIIINVVVIISNIIDQVYTICMSRIYEHVCKCAYARSKCVDNYAGNVSYKFYQTCDVYIPVEGNSDDSDACGFFFHVVRTPLSLSPCKYGVRTEPIKSQNETFFFRAFALISFGLCVYCIYTVYLYIFAVTVCCRATSCIPHIA